MYDLASKMSWLNDWPCRGTRGQIKFKRFAVLDDLGFDEVARIYLEECRTIRSLMARLFEPEARKGGHPGSSFFYAWLDARGFRESWSNNIALKRGRRAGKQIVEAEIVDEDAAENMPDGLRTISRPPDCQGAYPEGFCASEVR